jgi:maltose alpha-D-glucosyltransferase/alpha-amylase
MHLALASNSTDAAFILEAFNAHYQRSLYSSPENSARIGKSPGKLTHFAETDENGFVVRVCYTQIVWRTYEKKITSIKTRIYGGFHPRRVLFTGNIFIIIAFEGDPVFRLVNAD